MTFAKRSGASYRAFNSMDADAWITWSNWPDSKADPDQVDIAPAWAVWRDVNIAIALDADPEAQVFLDFLITNEVQILMKTEGWGR